VKSGLQGGDCNVDDCTVDESHAGAEDGGGKDPGRGLMKTWGVGRGRADLGFVARGLHKVFGMRGTVGWVRRIRASGFRPQRPKAMSLTRRDRGRSLRTRRPGEDLAEKTNDGGRPSVHIGVAEANRVFESCTGVVAKKRTAK